MSDIKNKIKQIKFSRLSFEERLVYSLLEDAKLATSFSTDYLVDQTNNVLVEVHHTLTKRTSMLLRFNYDILWLPLIHNKIDLNKDSFLILYLSERFNIDFDDFNVSKLMTAGGVSVKYLPYDKY